MQVLSYIDEAAAHVLRARSRCETAVARVADLSTSRALQQAIQRLNEASGELEAALDNARKAGVR